MRVYTKQPTASDPKKKRAQVNVLISGFSHQSQLSIEDVSAIVDAVPAAHLAGLDTIVYDPQWQTGSAQRLLETSCSKTSKAVYLRDERRILVFDFDDAAELRHALHHEIGHHVFERVLDSTVRKRWVTAINPKSRHITRYAALNPDEDFAESYAIFVSDPARLTEISRKYIFMRDEVFAGIARDLGRGHLDITV